MTTQTWFTSDEHYYHKNICKYAGRPFSSVDEMNETLISNHNNVVAQYDHVYHLGDFAFTQIDKIEGIIKRLNGIHRLILGNHDKEIINNRERLLGQNKFNSILPYMAININKQPIMLFHYGCRVWDRYHHGSWQLFGHSHNGLPPYGKSVDVGVDSKWITGKAEYRPFSFDEIKQYMNSRNIEYADMHKPSQEM